MEPNIGSHIMRKFILNFILISSPLLAQNIWDQGDISFQYGSPFPDTEVTFSGSFLSTELPGQGAGGFELSMGDTNLLTLVAYDIHVTEEDTLADIFTIIIQDSMAISPGYYVVGLGESSIKGFIWLRDVDPELIPGLIDTSFTLDSLDFLNPNISFTGQIQIEELGSGLITGNFTGGMINTELEMLMIANGSFSCTNSFPELSYPGGILQGTNAEETIDIAADLDLLNGEEGVGAFETLSLDTLNTVALAYTPEVSPEGNDGYRVYGMMFRTLQDQLPPADSDDTLSFNIASDDTLLPVASPFVVRNASMDQLLTLLAGDSLPDSALGDQLYLPAETGVMNLSWGADSTLLLELPEILTENGLGETQSLSEQWLLYKNLPSSIDPPRQVQPSAHTIVGPAFPNPFNSQFVIPISLGKSQSLKLQVFDILGRSIRIQDIGKRSAGDQKIHINFNDMMIPGGLYFYRLESATQILGQGSVLYLK